MVFKKITDSRFCAQKDVIYFVWIVEYYTWSSNLHYKKAT